jgi:hypothetical protein
LQWGGGGGVNVTVNGAINMNGTNSAIQMNPTGTGTVSIAAENLGRDSIYNDASFIQVKIAKKRMDDLIDQKKRQKK